MDEMIYVGNMYGSFVTEGGESKDYCNIFALEEFNGEQTGKYHYAGQKAVKYGCTSPEVFAGIAVNTKVQVFFDKNKKVCYMVPVKKA